MPSLEQMAADAVQPPSQPVDPTTPSSKVERAIADDADRRERERLAKRKEIRRQIAERERLLQQLEDLAAQLRQLDQRADAAAADHQTTTEPIQASLETAAGAKRTALLEKLSEANIALEQRLFVIDRVRNPLLKQHRETRSAVAGLPVENALAQHASPALAAEQFAAQQRQKHAIARVDQAQDQLKQLQAALAEVKASPVPRATFGWTKENSKLQIDLEAVHLLQQRIRRWQTELTHASSERHEAEAELGELHRQMLAE